MKVLLVNGSPHEKGCVYTALCEVAKALREDGVDTEIFHPIGAEPVRGCTGCGACAATGKCVFTQDAANDLLEKMQQADGIVLGSPVYYAGPNGAFCALLDRVFYASGGTLAHKPGAAIVNARRSGTTAAFDRLNKYFTISRMPLVPSQYWNGTHGRRPEDVAQDLEGLQTMRTLGHTMAWMLRGLSKSEPPKAEPKCVTNFIR